MRGPPHRHPDEPKAEFSALEGTIGDAAELAAGDRVVYPNQGVCAVTGVEVKEIAGQRLEFVRMAREEDGATVLIPRAKVPSVGLRRVASGELMEGVFHYLAAQYDDPELDWKVRHRDNADRMVAGGVLGVAEVVKGLHALSRLRPLPTKEREQYDGARHLLVAEVAVSLGVPPGLAEDLVDLALMPPAGTTFKLKPPPRPILMPSRPKRRRPALVTDDGLEGLGLDDLALGELGEEGDGQALDGGAPAAAAAAPDGDGLPDDGSEEAGGVTPGAADAEGTGDEVEEAGMEPAAIRRTSRSAGTGSSRRRRCP